MDSPFRTVKEAADWLRISDWEVRKKIRFGDIPARKHGGKIVIRMRDLERYSESSPYAVKPAFMSRFQSARLRLRSLTTEHTTDDSPKPETQRGVG